MKYYTIIILLIAISVLLYFGYKLIDIPKALTNTPPVTEKQENGINKLDIITRSNVFFNIKIGDKEMGNVVIELFDEDVPKTCNNFRHLCTNGMKNKKTPAYKNTRFNCVIKDFMIQGGDIINNNGSSGYSVYGKYFPDENFNLKHNQEGLISMANCGKDKNNSQFFILTKQGGYNHLDNKYVVFGIIIKGYDIIKKIEQIKTDANNNPLEECIISECGLVKEKENYTIQEVDMDDDLSEKVKICI
jgi:peptidyl-prolyl isomerase D